MSLSGIENIYFPITWRGDRLFLNFFYAYETCLTIINLFAHLKMESTSIDGIASYYPAIESAIESVSGGKLSLAGVIDKLHIDIVNLFNGELIEC